MLCWKNRLKIVWPLIMAKYCSINGVTFMYIYNFETWWIYIADINLSYMDVFIYLFIIYLKLTIDIKQLKSKRYTK